MTLGSGARLILLLLITGLASGLLLIDLLHTGFRSDDWFYLVLARHGAGPVELLWYPHAPTYAYRPLGVIVWWLAAQAFGLWAGGHYLINIALHALIAALVGALVALLVGWRLQPGAKTLAPTWPQLLLPVAAALLAVVHPAAVATTVWLSNRFDLLVSASALLVLWLLLAAPQRWTLVLLVAAVIIAVGSKELGFAILPAAGLLVLVNRRIDARRKGWMLVALGAPLALYLLLRTLVLEGLLGVMPSAPTGPSALDGVWFWWLQLGQFATGVLPNLRLSPLLTLGFFVLLMAALLAFLPGRTRGPGDPIRAALGAIALVLIAVSVLQSPVTRHVLGNEAGLQSITNYRFYHLATLLLLVAAVSLLARSIPAAGRAAAAGATIGLLLLATIAAFWTLQSRRVVDDWVASGAATQRQPVRHALWQGLAELPFAPPCHVQLLDPAGLEPDFNGFGDSLIKAGLPPQHPLLDCFIYSSTVPWFATVSAQTAPHFLEGPHRQSMGLPLVPRAAGTLYLFYPAAIPPVSELRRFCVRQAGFRELASEEPADACQ